jgi:hypothetical protein
LFEFTNEKLFKQIIDSKKKTGLNTTKQGKNASKNPQKVQKKQSAPVGSNKVDSLPQ